MSKEIQKMPDENNESPLAKIGLSDKQSRGAKYLRAILAGLKEGAADELKKLPGGSIAAGALESLQQLADDEAGEEDSRTLEEILNQSQQSSDDIKALDAVINLVFAAVGEQNELLEKLTKHLEQEGLPAAPEQIGEFATAAALSSYRNRVAREYHYAEYRGIEPGSERVATLPLDDVYVVPRLKAEQTRTTDHEREQDLISRLHNRDVTADEKARCELEYLRLVGERWHPGGKSEETGLLLGDALQRARHAVVKGTPGAGKSTLVRYVARACVAGAEDPEMLRWMADFTPIVLPLAAFAEARRQPQTLHLNLLEFLKHKTRALGGAALEAAMVAELTAGRVLILLDGVDEIPENDRELAVRAVDDFLLDFHANRVLITSRPYGYVRLAGDIAHFDLPHFSPEQVQEFVVKWQCAYERSVKPEAPDFEKAEREAGETLKEIRSNPRVADLATNPLLLVVISLIRHANIRLPEKRVELYQAAVRTLMGSWNKFRALAAREVSGTELPISRLISTWAAVAHWMRRDESTVVPRARLKNQLVKVIEAKQYDDNADAEATTESYLEAAANRAGLLEERGPNYFAFWHPTFEEFLAAHDMVKPASRAAERLKPHRDDARWREVILLSVGIIGVLNGDEETAGELVEALAFEDNGPLEELLYPQLRLAAACVADDGGVPRHIAEKIIVKLAQAVQKLPYAPLTTTFIQTVRALPNLKATVATVNALSPLAKYPQWEVRMEATRLFSNVTPENPQALQLCAELLQDSDEDVRCHAALGLARNGDWSNPVCKALLNYQKVETYAIATAREILANAPQSAKDVTFSVLKNPQADSFARYRAAELLQQMDKANERVVETLYELLTKQQEDSFFLYKAAELLQKMGKADERVVETLYELLTKQQEDLRSFVRYQAAELLQQMGKADERVVETLYELLTKQQEDLDYLARYQAAGLLQQMDIADERLIETLYALLFDSQENTFLRMRASELLFEIAIDDERLVETLYDLLTNPQEDSSLRYQAAELLQNMNIDDEQVVETLYELLTKQQEDSFVRYQATELLQQMDMTDERVVETLYELLTTSNEYFIFRDEVAYLLQKMTKADEKVAKQIVERFLVLLEVDAESVLPVCHKVTAQEALVASDVTLLRDAIAPRENDTRQKTTARSWIFAWLFETMEPKNTFLA